MEWDWAMPPMGAGDSLAPRVLQLPAPCLRGLMGRVGELRPLLLEPSSRSKSSSSPERADWRGT
jgi:hypothetical protein